mgnify:CR=1 FL=1
MNFKFLYLNLLIFYDNIVRCFKQLEKRNGGNFMKNKIIVEKIIKYINKILKYTKGIEKEDFI